jgi:hypothetical protein
MLLSSLQVTRICGCSYRQLDYWARLGAVVAELPAHGSGSHRRFTIEQAAQVRVVGVLTEYGASADILIAVRRALEADPGLWDGPLMVSRDGTVAGWEVTAPLADHLRWGAWLIDAPACRAHVFQAVTTATALTG